jgi:hypothetical protein
VVVPNGNGRGHVRLLTREHLDARTTAARAFDAIARGIATDLGGESQLSTVQKHLIEAFAGIAIHVNDLNARLLLGQEIDIGEHSQVVTTLVRVASRIGLKRVAKQIPELDDYLRTKGFSK